MPQITVGPETVGSEKCGICLQMFDAQFGDAPCSNCGIPHCPEHTDRETESELTPELCVTCGKMYRKYGKEGLKRVVNMLLHTHGS
ncbi:MAG: hypothetical protein V1885_03330 [Candidatus Brennerbacteria bacterium]